MFQVKFEATIVSGSNEDVVELIRDQVFEAIEALGFAVEDVAVKKI